MKTLNILLVAIFIFVAAIAAEAETLVWRGATHTMTIGLSEDDISHIEFPEAIINVTVENQSYVDILVVQGYADRAFRMRALLPKMATRTFFTGESGKTYIVVLTTDVPYQTYLQIVDGTQVDAVARQIAKKFDEKALVRAMAMEEDIPGILRETYVVPNWFKGAGLSFDLSEVWQSATLTGLIVHVRNEYTAPNEVSLPALTIPKTSEWGELRWASMENLRLAPKGKPNDRGLLFLVFKR